LEDYEEEQQLRFTLSLLSTTSESLE